MAWGGMLQYKQQIGQRAAWVQLSLLNVALRFILVLYSNTLLYHVLNDLSVIALLAISDPRM
jgi:hypothetical protein